MKVIIRKRPRRYQGIDTLKHEVFIEAAESFHATLHIAIRNAGVYYTPSRGGYSKCVEKEEHAHNTVKKLKKSLELYKTRQ